MLLLLVKWKSPGNSVSFMLFGLLFEFFYQMFVWQLVWICFIACFSILESFRGHLFVGLCVLLRVERRTSDQYRRQANILAGEYDLEKIINSECKYLSKKCAPLVYLPVLLQESKFASRNIILKSCAVYTTSSLSFLSGYMSRALEKNTRASGKPPSA